MKRLPRIKPSIENGKDVRLKIKKIIVREEFVKIVLEHWDFKWIDHLETMWSDEIHYKFGFSNSGFSEIMFELIIPPCFFEKYKLCGAHYIRQDKYETELLFEKNNIHNE